MIIKDKTLLQKVLINVKKVLRPVKADEVPGQGGATAPVNGVQPEVQTQQNQVVTQPSVQAQAQVQQPQMPINVEQLMAQVRKEEKDKLYPQINELKVTNQALVQKNNDLMLQVGTKEAKIQELTAKLETAEKNVADTDEVKALKADNATLKSENEKLKAQIEEGKLQSFKNEELAKYNGAIIPELVTGTTEEEIVESAKKSNARFLELTGGVVPGAQSNQQTAQAQQTQQNQSSQGAQAVNQTVNTAPNVTPTVANPVAGGVLGAQGSMSPDAIRGMSMEQFAEYRKQIGLGRR